MRNGNRKVDTLKETFKDLSSFLQGLVALIALISPLIAFLLSERFRNLLAWLIQQQKFWFGLLGVAVALTFFFLGRASVGAPKLPSEIAWTEAGGSIERKNNLIVLHDSNRKSEMWGDNFFSANLDCLFDLEFDRGMKDSSVGLEIWNPSEYSITFRGGSIQIVKAGNAFNKKTIESYSKKRIKVHLKANDDRLFAAIDGATLVDEKNTYWKGQELKPRLNADIGDKITLYSSSCVTK